MLTDKTKVTSDYNYLGAQKKSPCGLYSTFAVCFLYILVLGLFIFNFLTINRIKVLENDVENLKQTLSSFKVFDDNLIKDIIGFEDEEDIEAYDSDQNPKVVVTTDWNITEYDYENYDQSNENDTNLFDDSFYAKLMSKLNSEEDKGQYQSAADLTKDKLESKRTKRNIIAATDDGVIINSEPYAQKRARNLSSRYTLKGGSVTQYPARPSSIGSPWPVHPYPYSSTPSYTRPNTVTRRTTKAPTVLSRRSRVKHHEQGRPEPLTKSVKPYQLKSMGGSYFDSYEDTTTTSPDFTVVRDLGMNRRKRILKPLASAHYNGDTSNYIYGQHENFLGNGHLRHPQSRFVDWKASDWVRSLGMDNHFTLDNGYVTIKDSGLYLVYAQIYYLDEHDTTGYRVLKNDRTILQCTLTVHSVERRLKGNTCYTGGVEHFSANDKLSIEDITEGMLSKFEVGKSFFGIVKLGDAK